MMMYLLTFQCEKSEIFIKGLVHLLGVYVQSVMTQQLEKSGGLG